MHAYSFHADELTSIVVSNASEIEKFVIRIYTNVYPQKRGREREKKRNGKISTQ